MNTDTKVTRKALESVAAVMGYKCFTSLPPCCDTNPEAILLHLNSVPPLARVACKKCAELLTRKMGVIRENFKRIF